MVSSLLAAACAPAPAAVDTLDEDTKGLASAQQAGFRLKSHNKNVHKDKDEVDSKKRKRKERRVEKMEGEVEGRRSDFIVLVGW